jgi:hypothetical protein
MALPFLVILAGIIFSVTRAGLVKGQAIEQARNEAWHNRFSGSGGSLSAGAGAQLLGALAERSAESGLQTGRGSKSHGGVEYLAPASQYFFFGSVSSRAEHAVFSNPWDHEVIRFESQAPLMLDRRVFVFGAVGAALHVFAQMMSVLQPPHSAMVAWQKAQKAIDTIATKINELEREIQTVQDKIRDLRDRLETAIGNKDNVLADDLKREIDRFQAILARLKEAREKLQQGKNLGPQP